MSANAAALIIFAAIAYIALAALGLALGKMAARGDRQRVYEPRDEQ